MKTFYTLSSAAGLICTNKFLQKADAIAIGSMRAEMRGLPVKVFEHKEHPANKKCILVCNVDGSVEKPKGKGYEVVEQDHHAGVPNNDNAHVLLSASAKSGGDDDLEIPKRSIANIYLKSSVPENVISKIENELGIWMGLYDDRILQVYSPDARKLKQVETKLSEASVEVSRITHHTIKASTPITSSSRKAAQKARAAGLPEFSCRASVGAGKALKVNCHCEMFEGDESKSPTIVVYGDGQKLGEVKSEREANRLMADYAERMFGKFLKKEL